jgi:plastocyanin
LIVKRFTMLVFVIATVFGLAACGSSGGAEGSKDITIKGQDIKFDPTAIDARVGQTVNISFQNQGALDHTLVFSDFDLKLSAKPGETVRGSFTPTTAGTFKYHCDVAGHTEAGMVGTLTVTP